MNLVRKVAYSTNSYSAFLLNCLLSLTSIIPRFLAATTRWSRDMNVLAIITGAERYKTILNNDSPKTESNLWLQFFQSL